jgi:hypothetical protein
MALVLLLGASTTADGADIVGRASIGASGGPMIFTTGTQYKSGGLGRTRLIGHLVVKYNFSSKLAGVLETGYGWNSYGDADDNTDTIAVVVPTTLGVEYRRRVGETKIWPHAALGVGLYSLGIKDSYRTWAQAGDDAERLTWTSPGGYGKIGAEYLFDNGVSINTDVLFHRILSKDDRFETTVPGDPRFDSTWGVHNTSFAEFRIGVNYYFTIKSAGAAPPPEGDDEEDGED